MREIPATAAFSLSFYRIIASDEDCRIGLNQDFIKGYGETLMNVQTVAQTIQLILAPVVMVSACAILLGSLQARYGAINDRLRAMARERLDLLQPGESQLAPAFLDERLTELDTQIPLLLARHKMAHHAVLIVYSAVAIFIVNMFVIALASVVTSNAAATTVLILFLVGIGMLLVGVGFAAGEVSTSQRALYFEVTRVAALPRNGKR